MTIEAFFWDEHEEPQAVRAVGPFDDIRFRLIEQLKTKEYGKIVKTFDGSPGELTLYYRAFDDKLRGRQIVCGTDLGELDKFYQEQKRLCALKVLSADELYALKPIRVYYGSWHTVSVHLGEEVRYHEINLEAVEATERMETRTLVDHDFDGRRGWTLQTVWFDGKPVMVVNSAGRDGDEYHDRWITDAAAFGELVRFLNSFVVEQEDTLTGFVKASDKIPAMTEFYNQTIHDFYDVEAQGLKKT